MDTAKHVNLCKTELDILLAFLIGTSKGVCVSILFYFLDVIHHAFFQSTLFSNQAFSVCSRDGITMLEVTIFWLKNDTLVVCPNSHSCCQRKN